MKMAHLVTTSATMSGEVKTTVSSQILGVHRLKKKMEEVILEEVSPGTSKSLVADGLLKCTELIFN